MRKRLLYWPADFIGNAWLWGSALIGFAELAVSRVVRALRRK
jgi:hypothetical protein